MAGADFTALAQRIMRARSGGCCEGCGRPNMRLEAHHVQFRSRGGEGGAGNGLLLCGWGNASGCHGAAHTAAGIEKGWAVGTTGAPEQVARFAARFGGLVFMTDDGLVLAAEGTACWQHSGTPGGVAGCGSCSPVGRVLWDFEADKGWVF